MLKCFSLRGVTPDAGMIATSGVTPRWHHGLNLQDSSHYTLDLYYITHSMQQIPSWEASRFSADSFLRGQPVFSRFLLERPAGFQQIPSWEASRFSASQEFTTFYGIPNVHYLIHKCPPPVPILSQLDLVQTPPHPTSWRSILILSSHLRLGLFPSGFLTKTLYKPLLSPYALYAPPISFFSILSPEQHLVSNTDHQAPRYVVFSTPLSPRPS